MCALCILTNGLSLPGSSRLKLPKPGVQASAGKAVIRARITEPAVCHRHQEARRTLPLPAAMLSSVFLPLSPKGAESF